MFPIVYSAEVVNKDKAKMELDAAVQVIQKIFIDFTGHQGL